MLIKACLNGSRRRWEHEALPLSPTELAADAAACREAGAGAAHIHARAEDLRETLDPQACAAVIEAVRQRCPGMPVGLTTGHWIVRNSAQRLALIDAWEVFPDFCSVNIDEPGTEDLCQLLLSKGIAIEAGISSLADAKIFLTSPYRHRFLRVLIEIEPGEPHPSDKFTRPDGGPDSAAKRAAAIIKVLDDGGARVPRLLHGFGDSTWPLLENALARGYDIRVGLEDTLALPDGAVASGNAELIAAAARLAESSRAPSPLL